MIGWMTITIASIILINVATVIVYQSGEFCDKFSWFWEISVRFIGISLIVRGNVTVVAKLISDNVIMDYKKCIYND